MRISQPSSRRRLNGTLQASDLARSSFSGLMLMSGPCATKRSTASSGSSGVKLVCYCKASTLTLTRRQCRYAAVSTPVGAARSRTRARKLS